MPLLPILFCEDDCNRHPETASCGGNNIALFYLTMHGVAAPTHFRCCQPCRDWYMENLGYKVDGISLL